MDKQQTQKRTGERRVKKDRNNGSNDGKGGLDIMTPRKVATTPKTEEMLRASANDWEELGKFYVQLNPHTALADVKAKGGMYDLYLRFVPGETVRFGMKPAKEGEETQVMFMGGYKLQGEVPQGWVLLSKCPQWFLTPLTEREKAIEALAGDVTPWTEDTAYQLTQGKSLGKNVLRMYLPVLRYDQRNGQKPLQVPFGVTLVQEGDMVKVAKVYNPSGKIPVKEGDAFPTSFFAQQFPNPVSLILRVWKNMGRACFLALNPRQNGR